MTLIDRLSKLDGPDREVDAEIDRAFGLNVDVGALTGPWTDYPKPDHYRETSRYTASVDAAIALAERVLPGVLWGRDGSGTMYVLQKASEHLVYEARHTVTAIALCIALLRAKEAGE